MTQLYCITSPGHLITPGGRSSSTDVKLILPIKRYKLYQIVSYNSLAYVTCSVL